MSERFDEPTALTSSETGELLGVHPSTVKRWCNDGELSFSTTPGGHRRIRLDDAVALARAKDIPNILAPFHPYEPHVWAALRQIRDEGSFQRLHSLAMGWVHRSQLRRVSLLFDTVARHAGLSVPRLCDEAIGAFMAQVGDAWAQGRLRVGEEHLVSQTMTEVLLKFRTELRDDADRPRPEDPPIAVVGTLEGNQHRLGALCVRLALEAAGWEVFYLGADVPTEEFSLIQRGRGAALMCISLPHGAAAGTVARAVRSLTGLYDLGAPYALAFGGTDGGEIDEELLQGPFEDVRIFSSCGELTEALDAGFAPRAMAVR